MVNTAIKIRSVNKMRGNPVYLKNSAFSERDVFDRVTSIHQPTNAHLIPHKTLLKHFKTLRHVSILSDHHQGALFLAKVILQYSQFNSYLQTRCCDSISCVGMCCGAVARCASCVGMCCGAVARCASYAK